MFTKIRSRIAPDIAIDLGSTNTRVYVEGRGVVLEIPSVLAINMKTNRVVEVGEKARDCLGHRVGDVMVVGPHKNGQIVDASITAAFLRHCLEKVCQRHWWRKFLKPRVVIAVQSGVTEVEKFAMESAEEIRKTLSRQVSLIVECVREVIHEAGPKYAKGLRERGIVLSCGGSLLRGLDELLAKETGLRVVRAEAPASCAIDGVGMVMNELNR